MYQTTGLCNFSEDITFAIASCEKIDYAFSSSNITVSPKFEGSFGGTFVDSMFAYCSYLTEVKDIDFGMATDLLNIFAQCATLSTVGLLKVPNVTYIYDLFGGCSGLTTIAGLEGLQTDVSFADSPKLTNASVQNLIDKAADISSTGTKTMTFNAETFATITPEQTAAASAKGWTLASA